MTAFRVQLLLAAFCIGFAFISSTWVNGMSRLTKGRALRLQDEQPKKGRLLVKIAEDPPPFITSVLMLMLLARVASVVIVTGLLVRAEWRFAEVLSVLIMSFVLFQLAEIAPRTWVIERLDQVLLMSARPVYALGTALKPLALALVGLGRLFLLILPGRGLPRGPLTSEEEIKSILDVAESEEVIESGEREMIHSIFEFGDTVVREVMIPRPDMVCVPSAATLEEVLGVCLKKGYSRIPVISPNDIDNVVGIIYERDIIKRLYNGSGKGRPKKASDVARDAVFVPESKRVPELLREMQKNHTHMVIVVDEYGGTAGLATLEDLLEEIVGEISDEYDRDEPDVMHLEDGNMRVSARVSIDELNELLGTELPHEDWDSIGGLIAGILGRVPAEQEVVELQSVQFQVEKMKGRRIERVLVRRDGLGDSRAV